MYIVTFFFIFIIKTFVRDIEQCKDLKKKKRKEKTSSTIERA